MLLTFAYMVSRETSHKDRVLSTDFIAGVVSVCGTFFHTQSARTNQFGFQIKMSDDNYELVRMVRDAIGISNPIHIYKEGNSRYALLITRSQKTLFNNVIPFVDERIFGQKLPIYLQWKNDLLKQSRYKTD